MVQIIEEKRSNEIDTLNDETPWSINEELCKINIVVGKKRCGKTTLLRCIEDCLGKSATMKGDELKRLMGTLRERGVSNFEISNSFIHDGFWFTNTMADISFKANEQRLREKYYDEYLSQIEGYADFKEYAFQNLDDEFLDFFPKRLRLNLSIHLTLRRVFQN